MEGVNYGNGSFPRSDREVVCGREYVGDGARLGGTKDLAAQPSSERRRRFQFWRRQPKPELHASLRHIDLISKPKSPIRVSDTGLGRIEALIW